MGVNPVRVCAGCRTRHPQGELVRIVRRSDGTLWVDPGGSGDPRRPAGRGAYVCFDAACVEAALGSGALLRTLRFDAAPPEGLRGELLARARAGPAT